MGFTIRSLLILRGARGSCRCPLLLHMCRLTLRLAIPEFERVPATRLTDRVVRPKSNDLAKPFLLTLELS